MLCVESIKNGSVNYSTDGIKIVNGFGFGTMIGLELCFGGKGAATSI